MKNTNFIFIRILIIGALVLIFGCMLFFQQSQSDELVVKFQQDTPVEYTETHDKYYFMMEPNHITIEDTENRVIFKGQSLYTQFTHAKNSNKKNEVKAYTLFTSDSKAAISHANQLIDKILDTPGITTQTPITKANKHIKDVPIQGEYNRKRFRSCNVSVPMRIVKEGTKSGHDTTVKICSGYIPSFCGPTLAKRSQGEKFYVVVSIFSSLTKESIGCP